MNWAHMILWFVLMIVFLVAEAACPVHLISLWFAAGSLVALILAALNAPFALQAVLFFVVSIGLLIALWPFVKKFLNPRKTATNIDALIGAEGYVVTAVDNLNAEGKVKLGGMEWTARSTDGQKIPIGTLVKVDRIEGVKAIVSPVKEEVNV